MTNQGSGISETVREWAQKTLALSLVPAIFLFAYLIYGLFSGQLAGAAQNKADARHAVELVGQLSFYLNIALVIALVSALFLYYEFEALGVILLVLAAVLAYGIRLAVDYLGSGQLANGKAAISLFGEFRLAALIIGAPGVALVLKELLSRIVSARHRQDLSALTYGSEVAKQRDRPQALIGAFAACWQLPFCRDGIRAKCPIYHARTKCWKERVGCMCEENIILLAMGGPEKERAKDMTAAPVSAGGFVPIGDLIAKSNEQTKAAITTRKGPRGVRIPTNPHLSDSAKRQRCRNCVIYNEHQRQKYGFFSGPVTIAVPALVFWNYQNLIAFLGGAMNGLQAIVARFSFTGHPANVSEITKSLAGNMVVENVLIVCMTLVLMTWAQRLLEFACFKIKI